MNYSTKISQIGMMEMYAQSRRSCPLGGTDGLQDEVLAEAIEKADAEVEKIKQEVDDKKWRMVADKMKLMKVSTFSCRLT